VCVCAVDAARATVVYSLLPRLGHNEPHHKQSERNHRYSSSRAMPLTYPPRDPHHVMVRCHARHAIPIPIAIIRANVTIAITTTTTKTASHPRARDGPHRRAQ